jgi:Nitrate and nitrite sensing/Histidine kinase-, DNA gyrase B-, and HSP90-like ATPase
MLRRRSIRSRIIMLVLVPVVALLGLYAEVLNLTVGNLLTLKQEAAIRQLVALPVAHVQTQLGKERTLALQYLAKPGRGDLDLLLKQNAETNLAIENFRSAVRTALQSGPVQKEQQAFRSWQADLAKISELRRSVVSFGLSKIDAADAYTSMLTGGDNVLKQAIAPVLTGPLGVQATDLLAMARASQDVGEESDLLRADLIAGSFPPGDLTLISQLAVRHQEEWAQTIPDLDPVLRGYFLTIIPRAAAKQLASMEAGLSGGPSAAKAISLPAWTSAENAYQRGFLAALLKGAATLARQATTQAHRLLMNLILIAGIGLFAIVAAVTIGIILGRGLIRQLGDLRESAVKLSTEQLPGAISRLRAGEEIDVGAEVPRLAPSSDEIGQLREAFNTAARTAISAAVDEIKIRRGVNDVFRSLARRNQSLLTRQLQLLDSMERRVHDPEELADLFRVDHMTTRMRRHAEGLLIVAGGSSGRTWREPVPIVDVMRAAAAEVEDYTRIRVTSRTGAALAGHAVADIIHLLAELVENAATFSPANTPVRVDGEKVARGVVVEIEDRGLGMGDQQLAQINETLSDPPLFDLSGSDQLGLFIAGQLGRRHDVKVTLRSSAYGGITAVVLIPTELIVDVDESAEMPAITGIRELGGRPVPQLPTAQAEPLRTLTASAGAVASSGDVVDLGAPLVSSGSDRTTGLPELPMRTGEPDPWPTAASLEADVAAPELPTRQPGGTGSAWDNAISAWTDDAGSGWGVNGAALGWGSSATAAGGGQAATVPDLGGLDLGATDLGRSDLGSIDLGAVNGNAPEPTGAIPSDDEKEPADAELADVTPTDTALADTGLAGTELADVTATDTALADTGLADTELADVTPIDTALVDTGLAGINWDDTGPADSGLAGINRVDAEPDSAGVVEVDGLPVRVRQANLAPQLRQQNAVVPADVAVAAAGPSPEAARSTMAALQLGWQRGRSVTGAADDELPISPGPEHSGDSPGDSPDEGGSL